ncbi:MAG: hypothetical protein KDA20_07655 [Phycisphaerales bacterium]|nr:hypothetical protein [Phycisphaerales bacterium]
MPDEANDTAQESAPEKASKKGGLPLKTIILVFAMLVAEGGGIVLFMTMFGKPSPVRAQAVELDEGAVAEGDQLQEIQLLHEKLTNSASGRVFIYDAEILIVVKEKYREKVEQLMEQRMGAIRTGVSSIWAKAEHAYFSEPGRETLTRQTLDYLRSTFGKDASGDQRIENVLIPKCLGMPADF